MRTLRMSEDVFFFNDTATTEIYTLSLHDALPILADVEGDVFALGQLAESTALDLGVMREDVGASAVLLDEAEALLDRKSTRLNSSHANISYAVFCLKKQFLNSVFSLLLTP